MARPKKIMTEEERKKYDAEKSRRYRAKKTLKPTVTDPTDKVQLKADVETYLKKLGDVRTQITAYAMNDWCREHDYHDKPSCTGKFTLDSMVVDEMQEAARLKAKAQAFYDEKIRPHTIEKALQDAIEIGSLRAKTFPKGHDAEYLSEALTTIIDSLPIEENLIEGLKTQCRDAYRHDKSMSYRDHAVPPIPHRKNVRPTIVTPREVDLLNFAILFDKVGEEVDRNPHLYGKKPKGFDKPEPKKASNILNFFKKPKKKVS